MARVYPIQATFARGEGTPYLHGRVDIDHYRMMLATCINATVLPYGGWERRSGSRFVAEVKDSSRPTRLIEYEFSVTQTYVIELGHLYARFYSNGGRIENPPGTPVEVVTPWTEDEIFDVDYTSLGDLIYMFHGSHSPRELVRQGETDWVLNTHDFEDGPFQDRPEGAGSVRVQGTGNFVPRMTSDTTPSGQVTTGSAPVNQRYLAFDHDLRTQVAWTTDTTGWIQYEGTTARVIKGYSVRGGNNNAAYTPSEWTIQASNDGVSFTTLDSVSNETGWVRGEIRHYEIQNTDAYRYYRFDWSAVNGGDQTQISQIFYKLEPVQAQYAVILSKVDEINDGQGFLASDVGRHIRVQGTDAQWRWGKIVSRQSTTQVTAQWYGPVFTTGPQDDLPPETSNWKFGSWSETTGWPSRVQLYSNRLWSGRTNTEPSTVWGSAALAPRDHGISNPVLATDAIDVPVIDSLSGEIQWLSETYEALLTSAEGRQRTLSAANRNEGIGPANINNNAETRYKAAAINPISTGNRTIFSDRSRKRLREYGLAVDIEGFNGPDLSLMGEHLFRSRIVEMDFVEDPYPVILSVVGDGRVASMTYDPDQQVAGLAQVRMGGTWGNYSYAPVMSNAAISNAAGDDEHWVIVKRTIDGVTKQYVEYFAPRFEANEPPEQNDVLSAEFLDSSVPFSTTGQSIVLGGYDHLIGETVGVFADGLDLGDFTVDSSGNVTIPPEFDVQSGGTVGLRYQTYVKTLRAPTHGNRDGSGMGRQRVVGEVFADVYNTGYLEIGTLVRVEDVVNRSVNEVMGTPQSLKTGMVRVAAIDDIHENGGVLVMQTDRALPAVVRAIQMGLQGEP